MKGDCDVAKWAHGRRVLRTVRSEVRQLARSEVRGLDSSHN